MSLKLASVNIERSKHLARIEAFFDCEAADVVCLQEVAECDVAREVRVVDGVSDHCALVATVARR